MVRWVCVVLVAICFLAPAVQAVSCIECAKYVEKFSSYCEHPKVGRFVGVCSEEPQATIRECVYTAKRVRNYASTFYGMDDGCAAVGNMIGDAKFQQRLQLCCSPHVQCDSGGQGFSGDLCPWRW